MRTFGIIVAVCGVIAALFALNMNVAVPSFDGSSVNNIGLMNDRQNYILISGFAIIAGVIMATFGGRSAVVAAAADPFDEAEQARSVDRKRYAMELGVTRRDGQYFYEERPYPGLEAAISGAERAQNYVAPDPVALAEAEAAQREAEAIFAHEADQRVYKMGGIIIALLILVAIVYHFVRA